MIRSILLISIFWAGVFVTAVAQEYASKETKKKNGPVISWDTDTHAFGDIIRGNRVEQTFSFTNTGNEPLVIINVEVTCGCTTPKGWPKDPIPPGARGEIHIAFDSTAKLGKQNKIVRVVSNSVGNTNQVSFTANVLLKENH